MKVTEIYDSDLDGVTDLAETGIALDSDFEFSNAKVSVSKQRHYSLMLRTFDISWNKK